MHRFQLIDQKQNLKSFFRPQVVRHLFQIQFPAKKFFAKIIMKMHRFQLEWFSFSYKKGLSKNDHKNA